MIARLCGYPGCSRVASGYYCKEHAAQAEARKEKERTLFKGTLRARSGAYHALYGSAKWKAMRRAFLARNPVCVMCGARAEVADHIAPHRGDAELFFNEANLQPLCRRCHSAKTLAENGFFRRDR